MCFFAKPFCACAELGGFSQGAEGEEPWVHHLVQLHCTNCSWLKAGLRGHEGRCSSPLPGSSFGLERNSQGLSNSSSSSQDCSLRSTTSSYKHSLGGSKFLKVVEEGYFLSRIVDKYCQSPLETTSMLEKHLLQSSMHRNRGMTVFFVASFLWSF